MYNKRMLRKELKELFMQELTPSEKLFFLKTAREGISQKGYPAGEELFYYCYFHTLKERIRGIRSQGGEGYMRFLLVEGTKDIEETIKMYEGRLEKSKLSTKDPAGHNFIEYLSE
jgi:hypothetical protein